MKKKIFKKIINLSLLALILISFLAPLTSFATITTKWYYAYNINIDLSEDKATGGFDTKAKCEESRLSVIKNGLDNGRNFGITSCKSWTGEETSDLAISKRPRAKDIPFLENDLVLIQDVDTGGAIQKWWYMYKNGIEYEIKPGGNLSFRTKKECEDDIITIKGIIGTDFVLASPCSQTKPTIPDIDKPEVINTDIMYTPLAPLPGIEGSIDTTTGFGSYLNTLIKLFIGICAVLSMIMIVIGGIEYMTSELASSKEAGKERITNAIFGLILALGSYAILNTLNPALLNISLSGLPQVEITISSGSEYRLSQTQKTDTKFIKTSYYNKIKTVSESYNIPHCLLQVAIQRESGGIPGLIGHDENAPETGVPSRKEFVMSGKKFSGETFTPDNSLIKKRKFLNDDNGSGLYSASNPGAEDLGLDWRFSHGIGLFQVTLFPKDKAAGFPTIKPKDLYDETKSINKAAQIMSNSYKFCKNDILGAFTGYGAGSGTVCSASSGFIATEAPLRKNLYDQCVAQDN